MLFRKFFQLFFSSHLHIRNVVVILEHRGVKGLSMKIGDKLRNRRKELGLSMKEVADRIGVAEATVSRWESGDIANMKRNYIRDYAKVLHVSPLYIMGEEDQYVEIDSDLTDLFEALHSRSEMKMLFKTVNGMTKEQIEAIVHMAESFKGGD